MVIVDTSDIEDLSDGEDNNPAVDKVILNDADLMDVEGDGSDEEYSPPDAAENSDTESENQPQNHQVHKCGRKRQHVNNDGELEPVFPFIVPPRNKKTLCSQQYLTISDLHFQICSRLVSKSRLHYK